MSRLNTLLHGPASEAADLLSGDSPSDRGEIILELRAALTNALQRIVRLEDRIDSESERIEKQIELLNDRTETWLNKIEDRIS